MLCLFVSAISLASAAHLSDSYASDFASSNYWQYEEVDSGEINDLFYPISSDEFFIHRPLFFVTSIIIFKIKITIKQNYFSVSNFHT